MDFYLLGDNEREESTGYLYLEFRKPGMEEYRTIGVGMRAQRGKGIDFWGFCLQDGRRIGPGGLCLCETMESRNYRSASRNCGISSETLTAGQKAQQNIKRWSTRRSSAFGTSGSMTSWSSSHPGTRAQAVQRFRPSEVKKILNQSPGVDG